MNILFMSGILCMLFGIGVIAGTFLVQRKENQVRPEGLYTEGVVLSNRVRSDKKNMQEVTFEFMKDFRMVRCTMNYEREEAKNLKPGRKYLIVYDDQTDRVYCNPMKKYRTQQNWLMIIGGIILLIGINVSMIGCGLLMS